MSGELMLNEGVRHDPVTRYGQDLLYFPNAIPDVTTQLIDELTLRHQQSLSNTPEQVEAKVKRDVMRTFIGVVATIVYSDLAERLVPHIKQGRPLVTEQFPRTPFYRLGGLPRYVGYADDFARAGTAWLFGAAARVFTRAENPEDRYRLLIKALTETTRDSLAYVAEDPQKRSTWGNIQNIQAQLGCLARHAANNFSYFNLTDNVKVALEMMLQFGLAYSREEQALPEGDQLTAAALAHARMMGRAATIGETAFQPMAHNDPLATTFHDYELTQLTDVEELYPLRESIFTRKDGEYTFRYPPLAKGPKKQARNCPGRRAWRPPGARGQDAVEALFACAEQYGGCSIPRPGDGTFQTAIAALVFGGFIARETIYAAWPKRVTS